MTTLIAGLVLFLGMHSFSIVAAPLRDRLAAKSELGWKAVYSIVSIAGFVLIIQGYSEARIGAEVLYTTPRWLWHVASLFMLPTFILFIAPYFPGRISTAAKHPQLVAVKLWAFSHLLINGSVPDVLLFGSLLAWGVVDRISMKRREQRALPGLPKSGINDIVIIVVGLALYAATVLWLHERFIGGHLL